MDGVTLLYCGGAFAARTAVCLSSLRDQWTGAVTLVATPDCEPVAAEIAKAGDADLVVVPKEKMRRNGHYLLKTRVPDMVPYDRGVLIDTDCAVYGPLEPLFDEIGKPGASIVLTQFSDWQTLGPKMRKRVAAMSGVRPMLDRSIELQLTESWPAINTGVVGWDHSPDAKQFRAAWTELTAAVSPRFMADELIAQAMLPIFPGIKVVQGSRWNCSCMFDSHWPEAAIIHYHGDKHLRDVGQAKWVPIYKRLYEKNWAGIRDWAVENDGKLKGLA